MLDEIDIKLLEQCNQNPGQPLKNAITPLLKCRGVRTLYERMAALGTQGFIEIDRSQKKVALAKITPKGKDAIRGRVEPALVSQERDSP